MYPKDSNYLCADLLFQDLKSIKNIAVLLNGNMRTPKIEALHRLIDWLNARTTHRGRDGFKIYNLGLDNSWLGMLRGRGRGRGRGRAGAGAGAGAGQTLGYLDLLNQMVIFIYPVNLN